MATIPATSAYVVPPALRPGSRVAVMAFSGRIVQDQLEKGLAVLRGWDLEPVVLESARSVHPTLGYLGGTDELRARDLEAALTDPAYDAVLLGRGGYGAQRALDLVDWSAVAAAGPRPRHVVGFSDATALQEALLHHLGWTSLYGPMVATWYFEQERAQQSLRQLLLAPDDVTGIDLPDAVPLVDGTAQGVVLGGCATLLSSSIGTATSVPARDAILFLEDVDEDPFRLDRVFTQLRRSGYLDGVRGVLTGTFDGCGEPEAVREVLRDRFGDLGVPVLTGADIGHGVALQTLPIGRPARLDTYTRRLDLL
ncbi:S66 peptidase family protein [Luteipulveratus flavus]|uniref:LD-carboxypeptidase n=1 Tax=Luteipulveratus flavus TaxID=3031728 RepID=A0ABT6C3H7_9MICO|nr:LD-carboxypeptidase [Luteipulveratus sp. YIM 133296]MDF8263260.1 LD-carboxypeptidase [Luteipulveratus sp. YIM 133296]